MYDKNAKLTAQSRYAEHFRVTRQKLEAAMEKCLERIEKNAEKFGDKLINTTSGWNLWYPIVFSACIATVIVWLWRNDAEIEHLDFSYLVNVVAIVFLAIAIASCPKLINSSIVTDMEFKEIEIIEKHINENNSRFAESYRFQLGYEDELIDSEGFSVSKEYYNN